MKEKIVVAFWGVVLILLGVWLLISGQSVIQIQSPVLGAVVTGGLSLLFFTSYFLSGIRHWGWLIPACLFAGTTFTIVLTMIPGVSGSWIGSPVLFSLVVPFLVIYLIKPEENRWALIPMYVFIVLTLVTLLAEKVAGEIIGSLFLFAIALPFLFVYLNKRERIWAFIVFAALALIGVIPLLALFTNEEWIGVVVMIFFAIPFAVLYLINNTHNWWALIPAGFFTTIAVVVLLTTLLMNTRPANDLLIERLGGGVLFLGWTLTFLMLWMRRKSISTAWAVYPALVLGVLSLTGFIGGQTGLLYSWPLALIVGGLLLMFNSFRSRGIQQS